MEIRKRLARNMKQYRAKHGWSQEELAFECGLHRTYISGIERGVRNPTVTILEKIAVGLKVTASELIAE
jgi:transcriptional regulator with XRE-family HTH domain